MNDFPRPIFGLRRHLDACDLVPELIVAAHAPIFFGELLLRYQFGRGLAIVFGLWVVERFQQEEVFVEVLCEDGLYVFFFILAP